MALKFKYTNDITTSEKAKTILFSRWLSMCYHTDVMNNEDGIWWLRVYKEFEDKVLPNYEENESLKDMIDYINENKDLTNYCVDCNEVIDFDDIRCNNCEMKNLPF